MVTKKECSIDTGTWCTHGKHIQNVFVMRQSEVGNIYNILTLFVPSVRLI